MRGGSACGLTGAGAGAYAGCGGAMRRLPDAYMLLTLSEVRCAGAGRLLSRYAGWLGGGTAAFCGGGAGGSGSSQASHSPPLSPALPPRLGKDCSVNCK